MVSLSLESKAFNRRERREVQRDRREQDSEIVKRRSEIRDFPAISTEKKSSEHVILSNVLLQRADSSVQTGLVTGGGILMQNALLDRLIQSRSGLAIDLAG